jgi:hypothetical protein
MNSMTPYLWQLAVGLVLLMLNTEARERNG